MFFFYSRNSVTFIEEPDLIPDLVPSSAAVHESTPIYIQGNIHCTEHSTDKITIILKHFWRLLKAGNHCLRNNNCFLLEQLLQIISSYSPNKRFSIINTTQCAQLYHLFTLKRLMFAFLMSASWILKKVAYLTCMTKLYKMLHYTDFSGSALDLTRLQINRCFG